MADIDGKDLTLDDEFSIKDGAIYFKDSDGEFSRASNIKTFFNRVGISVDEGDVGTAVFVQSEDVSTQETVVRGITFKPDGLKVYITGYSGTSEVNEYSLSTAWDVSTASHVNAEDVSAKETEVRGIAFNDDGTKMYICGSSSDAVHEYDLSTAYLTSSSTFLQTFSVSAQETFPSGLTFDSGGDKMYVCGSSSAVINEYDLSTSWDISTAVFNQAFDPSSQENSPRSVKFSEDGTIMYVAGVQNDSPISYNLSTAWDVSTAVFFKEVDVSDKESQVNGVYINPYFNKMYVVGESSSDIHEYDISITAKPNGSVNIVSDTLGDGKRVLEKIIEIGSWDMDADPTSFPAHGIDVLKIRKVTAIIFNDAQTIAYDIGLMNSAVTGSIEGGFATIASNGITLIRLTGGFFDSTDFNDTSVNRGYVTITYVE